MKLMEALNSIEKDYGVVFETRDHFQNFILTSDDTELNYFSIYLWSDELPEEAESNKELLHENLSNLIIEFKGAYAYHGATYNEFIEALREHTAIN